MRGDNSPYKMKSAPLIILGVVLIILGLFANVQGESSNNLLLSMIFVGVILTLCGIYYIFSNKNSGGP